MSNFLAVAAVTRSLQELLEAALQENVAGQVPGAHAVTQRVDDGDLPNPSINVFLYGVTPNPAARNRDLPTRDGAGRRSLRPQAAVDLHYLLTFTGDDKDLQPQRMLGLAVRTLHERPLITVPMVRAAATGSLATTDLARQGEPVRIVPAPLGIDDLTKLWGALSKNPYKLSIAYQASVVLLEGSAAAPDSLPVSRIKVDASASGAPLIERLAASPSRAAVHGGDLLLAGAGLRTPGLKVRVGAAEPAVPAEDGADGLRVALNSPDLRAGVQGVQVVQVADDGRTTLASNLAAFVLHPRPTHLDHFPAAGGGPSRIRVQVAPGVGAGQWAELLLVERPPSGAAPGWRPRSHRLDRFTLVGPPGPPPPASELLDFECPGVAPGTYVTRIVVDGASSAVDYAPSGATPAVVVT